MAWCLVKYRDNFTFNFYRYIRNCSTVILIYLRLCSPFALPWQHRVLSPFPSLCEVPVLTGNSPLKVSQYPSLASPCDWRGTLPVTSAGIKQTGMVYISMQLTYRSRYNALLRAGRLGFNSRQGSSISLFATAVSIPAVRLTQPPIQWAPAVLSPW
jgi:hypothetical protein